MACRRRTLTPWLSLLSAAGAGGAGARPSRCHKASPYALARTSRTRRRGLSRVVTRRRSPRVEAADAGAQARQPEQRVDERRRLIDGLADLSYGREQRVDLEWLAGLGILEHRGLHRAELAGHGVAVVRAFLDRAADLRADGGRLRHHPPAKGVDQFVVEYQIGRRPGERGDRVHGHVAPELVPDVAAD